MLIATLSPGGRLLLRTAAAYCLFQSGITTAAELAHISGRGAGMDIIKEPVVKQGGSISIVFTKPKKREDQATYKPFCIAT